MPSVFTPHGGTRPPRWRGARNAAREHSTAQDSALWHKDDFPPRLMSSMPGKKPSRDNVMSESPSTTTPPQNIPSSPRSPWERDKTYPTLILTGKRKAGIAVKPPPPRRRKVESNSRNLKMQNEEHIRQTLDLPTREEYPALPPGILDAPKLILHNLTQGIMTLHSDFAQLSKEHFRCHVSCTIPGRERMVAIGEDQTKVCVYGDVCVYYLTDRCVETSRESCLSPSARQFT